MLLKLTDRNVCATNASIYQFYSGTGILACEVCESPNNHILKSYSHNAAIAKHIPRKLLTNISFYLAERHFFYQFT
ncbi:MAG: hypothetical protein EAZ92_09240 [Candidatus Kapaibacterium sp.]|nr:MAG: hypothetical protein EAZ92_09240 [Candidatus Kapabacteria bacterium]